MTLEDAAKAFDDAALRIDTAPATELARWTTPIFLAVSDHAGMNAYAGEVEAAVRAMAAIAGVTVNRVAWQDPRANFVVRPNTSEYAGKSPCRSSVDWTDAGLMMRAEIHVNLANPGRITRCINHEVMHGFGFRGHPHSSFSVLSYKYAAQAQLTDTDRVILQTLYDPRLQPGMRTPAASQVACSIIAEKLHSQPADAAAACGHRGAVAARRGTLAFSGSRLADEPAHPPSLQPGYRDGGM
ncbi:MAG: DUF2927 domain-containing protein [Alphaproteobacteria bacterium]|nr:DUF2927 domain-containing protein [Alphaproteobacteria bacterium]